MLLKSTHPDYVISDGNKFFLDKDDSAHYSIKNEVKVFPIKKDSESDNEDNTSSEEDAVVGCGWVGGWVVGCLCGARVQFKTSTHHPGVVGN